MLPNPMPEHVVSRHLLGRTARLGKRHVERLQRLALGGSTIALAHLADLDVHTDDIVVIAPHRRFHRWRVIAR